MQATCLQGRLPAYWLRRLPLARGANCEESLEFSKLGILLSAVDPAQARGMEAALALLPGMAFAARSAAAMTPMSSSDSGPLLRNSTVGGPSGRLLGTVMSARREGCEGAAELNSITRVAPSSFTWRERAAI